MKLYSFILVFIFFLQTLYSQEAYYQPFVFPETIDDTYHFDPLKVYNEFLTEEFGKTSQRDKEIFCELVSFGEYHDRYSGNTYLGWEDLEAYITDIKNILIPDSIPKEEIRMFVERSAVNNAFTTPLGNLYLNIGLIAEATSEADLAFTVGHELSHAIFHDSKLSFLKILELEKHATRSEKKRLSEILAKYDRSFESRADSVGLDLCLKAGYESTGAINSFEVNLIEKELYKRDKNRYRRIVNINESGEAHNPRSLLLASHPEITDRIDDLKRWAKNDKSQNEKKFYLFGEDRFSRIVRIARTESLHILLMDNENQECVEKAFKYFLFEPDNKDYVYYILEGLRRMMYLDPALADFGFLTDRFPNYFKKDQGILSNLGFLIPDSSQFQKILVKELLEADPPLFNTYRESIDYFKRKALIMDIKEAYLTLALLYIKDPSNREYYIDKYLSFDNPIYREFAESLLNETIFETVQNNERQIVLMDEIWMLEEKSYGYHLRQMKSYQEEESYYQELSSFYKQHYPVKEFISIPSYRKNSFNKYHRLKDVLNAATVFTRYNNQLEKQNRWKEEIKEGVSLDGSETFIFEDDDYEEGPVLTHRDKREYKSNLKKKRTKPTKTKPIDFTNQSIDDEGIYKQNLYVYAPYCWDFVSENDLTKIEYIELFTYQNHTFGNILGQVLTGEKDEDEFSLHIFSADVRLKKAFNGYKIFEKNGNPSNVVEELKDYYNIQ